MLRRLGIRGKVLAALSVPVVVLFLLAGLFSWQAIQQVRTTRAVEQVLDALEQSYALAEALQEERSVSLAVFGPMAGDVEASGDIEDARERVDVAMSRYRSAAGGVDFDALDPSTRATFQTFDSQLGVLNSARGFVDARQVAMLTIDQAFASLIGGVTAFPEDVAQGLSDRELALVVATESQVQQLMEGYSHELALGREVLRNVQAGVISAEAINDSTLQAISALIAQNDEFRLDVSSAAYDLGTDTAIPEVVVSVSGAVDQFPQMRRDLRNLTAVRLTTWPPDEWSAAAEAEIDEISVSADEMAEMGSRRASSVANASLREAALTISVTALAVILSVVVALSIARAIVRPVRRLTDAAATVRDELPNLVEQVAIPGQGPDLRLTRIPVTSRDEIGRLAQAFNEVNQTTIEVAQEQAALRASIAEMFVNVARRDQVLLNRQLSFIDALERAEENPKTLADLFRLDHLATRMRRNSESLLVLAGIDTGRRLREPLPTSDVIRTASSEIEHYERIQLELPVDPMMLGHTALPAAHMLAELLENATVFSDPGTPVHVSTGIDETAVLITIQDQGLGMTPDELTLANSRLQTSSASDVLGSQRLGLYVVGRIATRLGASVSLSLGPEGRGTLATVRMPLVLFVNPEAIPLTPPVQQGRVESFVRLEEAAEAVHDTAYAPVPELVQDVAAGAYGSAENPAEAVDIEALVEGTTQTGLPKRRSHADAAPSWDMSAGNAAAASAIPLAPAPEALAGAVQAPEEMWQPPIVQASTPLVPRRRTDEPADLAGPAAPPAAPTGLPQRQPAAPASGLPVRGATGSQPPVPQSTIGGPTPSGLPARRPAAPGVPPAREAVDTASASGPANIEGRTAMFAGFRSRRAELAAAAIHEAGADSDELGQSDAVERLAAQATGAARFFQRDVAQPPAEGEPADEPLVIPALVDDEDEYGDEAFAPGAPAAEAPAAAQVAVEPQEQPQQAEAQSGWPPSADAAPHAAPAVEADFPVFEPTRAPAPAGAPAWSPTQEEAPAAEAPAVWAAEEAVAVPEPSPWVSAPAAQAPEAPDAAPAAPPVWSPTMDVTRTHEVTEVATPAAPPAVPTPFPSAPAAPAPTGAPAGGFGYSPEARHDFEQLMQGPTRRSLRQQPRRRGLFRRSRPAAASAAPAPAAPPVTPAVPPSLPSPASSGDGFPVFAPTSPPAGSGPSMPPVPHVGEHPVRQSAWGAPQPGSHVDEPTFTPPPAQAGPPPADPPADPPTPAAPPVEPPQRAAVWTPAEAPQWAAAPMEPQPWTPPPAPAAVPEPRSGDSAGGWQPAAPAAESPAPEPTGHAPAGGAGGQAPYAGPTSFTPKPMFGFDEEMTSMLAQRADIAQQALAELNQLSTYRPQAVAGAGSSKLVRRTPSAIPAAPEISKPSAPRPARDANQVRSLLSSFQSGTTRGRQLAEGDPQTAGDHGHAGSTDGPDGRGEPVTTPDDQTPRDAAW